MKKILYILILIISFLIINNLLRSIYSLWQKNDLIVDAQEQLQKEKTQNERLKDQLTRVKRPDFIEEEARNKLLMTKDGEEIILLGEPKEGSEEANLVPTSKIPIWKQWFEYFFK